MVMQIVKNIIEYQEHSKFRGDIEIPNVTFCDYVWDNLEAHGHLPGLVCGLSGRTLLHGQVHSRSDYFDG